MPSIRAAFVEKFSESDAQAIESAAIEHQNGIHNRRGSDPFKWALCICIGYQCFEKPSYRKYHGIKTPYRTLKVWIRNHADLASHDGDFDFLAMVIGIYDTYVKKTKTPSMCG